jgi:hypothetical protein
MHLADYRHIPLYRRDGSIRAHALVDVADAPAIECRRWHVGSNGYARRGQVEKGTGRIIAVLMHRVLMGLEEGDQRQVDHINRDKLDNRRSNLRLVTGAINAQNTPSRAGSSSRFRGVYWDSRRSKWRSQGSIDGVRTRLGTFDTEIEAACAVEAWRRSAMPYAEPDPELVAVMAMVGRLAA